MPPIKAGLTPDMVKVSETQPSPLGIIAAAGEAPLTLARHVIASGRDVYIIALDAIADADFTGIPHARHRIGALGNMLDDVKRHDCWEIVFAGRLKRTSLASMIAPDLRAIKIAVKAMLLGDDKAFKLLKDDIAKDGITIVAMSQVMPSLRTDEGLIAGPELDADHSDDLMDSILLGAEYLRVTGRFDIGQSCIVQGARILAIEAAEGTDDMMVRARDYINHDLLPAVMVKMLKTGQDKTFDPPAIGADTVKTAFAAGIKVIAIEADGVIIIDRLATAAAANTLGLTLLALPRKILQDI